MKKRLLGLLLVSACAGTGSERVALGDKWTAAPGQKAAEFALPDLSGRQVILGRLRGKVVVVDFWASWCEPCQKELPELQKIADEMAPRVMVLALNIDKDPKAAAQAARMLHLTLPVLLDPQGKVAEQYNPPKMPTSYVIDREGTLRYVHEGYDGVGDMSRLRQELIQLTQ